MNEKELIILHTVHVIFAVVLIAYTFYACAAPLDTRKRVLAMTGVSSLLVLLTGIRMWQGMFGFAGHGWVIVKLVCWLGLSALAGFAYRKREKAGGLMLVALVLAAVAVVMVYFKPFPR